MKTWTRRARETATWLIWLGLLAASVIVAAVAALAWLVTGSEIILTLGLGSGLFLGLAGVWHFALQARPRGQSPAAGDESRE